MTNEAWICEDCVKHSAVLFKSPDGMRAMVCLRCRDKYPNPQTWLLHDTCVGCGRGERYCECGTAEVPA